MLTRRTLASRRVFRMVGELPAAMVSAVVVAPAAVVKPVITSSPRPMACYLSGPVRALHPELCLVEDALHCGGALAVLRAPLDALDREGGPLDRVPERVEPLGVAVEGAAHPGPEAVLALAGDAGAPVLVPRPGHALLERLVRDRLLDALGVVAGGLGGGLLPLDRGVGGPAHVLVHPAGRDLDELLADVRGRLDSQGHGSSSSGLRTRYARRGLGRKAPSPRPPLPRAGATAVARGTWSLTGSYRPRDLLQRDGGRACGRRARSPRRSAPWACPQGVENLWKTCGRRCGNRKGPVGSAAAALVPVPHGWPGGDTGPASDKRTLCHLATCHHPVRTQVLSGRVEEGG